VKKLLYSDPDTLWQGDLNPLDYPVAEYTSIPLIVTLMYLEYHVMTVAKVYLRGPVLEKKGNILIVKEGCETGFNQNVILSKVIYETYSIFIFHYPEFFC